MYYESSLQSAYLFRVPQIFLYKKFRALVFLYKPHTIRFRHLKNLLIPSKF